MTMNATTTNKTHHLCAVSKLRVAFDPPLLQAGEKVEEPSGAVNQVKRSLVRSLVSLVRRLLNAGRPHSVEHERQSHQRER